ncbi:MAG: LysR family transcriptional regulator [Sandaracinus sp.]|nr:LysR family transcriptional regulator [Sandaracinus sp.]MCB9636782.1 LysR family transcriptional regulator [Sandaracinus sp.]
MLVVIASSQNPFRWDDARVLLALHRGRTLTAAAASLGVEPSTVGRRIDALEEALGARLFERTPDGAIPTLAAEELVPHAEAMESAAYALAGRAEGFERHVEGTVRLSVPPGIADLMIAPALPALLARHPELRVELDARIAYVDLARREADLVLRGLRPERGDLVAARLVEAESIPFVSRSAPLTKVRAPESLPWITYGEDLAHIPDARWVLGVAAPSRLVLRTNSYTSQIAAAEAGVGCVLVARELGQERPGLRPVAFTPAAKKKLPPFPRGSLWLVAHRSARHVPRVAAVWDFLVDRFRAR